MLSGYLASNEEKVSMSNTRTALVTGATKGVGLALSSHLTESGWDVAGIARQPIDDFPGTLVLCDLANA